MRWFEIALVVLTLASGLIWLLDKLFLAKRRAARGGLLEDADEPVLVDYAKSFFPVLAAVLMLRSFVAEPFRIPSNSMMPTLLTGDFILVNKFSYGLRLPISNQKVVSIGEPQRGDVVVFKPPHHPEQDWIKRIIGLPGDTIAYHDHQLFLNGKPVTVQPIGVYQGIGNGAEMTGAEEMQEALPGRPHHVLERTDLFRTDGDGEWTVTPGHYFVMGDNRDNSEDSRYWGLLPESNLRGKAFLIWLNCEGWFCTGAFDASRVGTAIK
ncbi:signal peptidase I [Cognatilysobacter terrigena]|uniref:signal peptidase I n=1 Tax=Cognatilysobacter terrigena TaxID=2488749 RepID=UPI00105EB56E|nr:signal peptidase I [Lysobacter terrigena]